MKIALKSQGAGWVIDSIVNDYKKYSKHEIMQPNQDPDAFWSVNLFSYPLVHNQIKPTCKKVVQVHHIDETKLPEYDFDSYNTADVCIIPNIITEEAVKKYMSVPTARLPYWLLSSVISDRDEDKISKVKQEISNGEILIGSFVKDGNGKIGETPKLSKGPDIFVEVLEKLHSSGMKVKAVLGGFGRKYVIENLKRIGVPYVYLERYDDINTLYDCLDWYLVTSRTEGGPQSILEASYRNVKILSTKMGMAPEVLHSDCLCNTSDDFATKIKNGVDQREYNRDVILSQHMPENVVPVYDDFFRLLYNN